MPSKDEMEQALARLLDRMSPRSTQRWRAKVVFSARPQEYRLTGEHQHTLLAVMDGIELVNTHFGTRIQIDWVALPRDNALAVERGTNKTVARVSPIPG